MICVSVQEKTLEGCLAVLKNSRMAELRADLCRLSVKEVEQVVASHPNILITCRIANSSEAFAREQITAAIRKGAKYVDVEIEAPVDFLEYIKVYAHENGAKLIISYHNFEQTPALDELRQIAQVCRRKGADIVKIVTTAHAISDAVRTLHLYKTGEWAKACRTNNYSEQKDVMLLAFAMGAAGKFSRYVSLFLGAPYTYVSYGEQKRGISGSETAPGQYTRKEMESLLEEGTFTAPRSLAVSSVSIPCSKSVAQRAILAAAFSTGESILENFEPCNDINGAVGVIKALGCEVVVREPCPGIPAALIVRSPGVTCLKEKVREMSVLEVGESGLLSRLLIPFAAWLSGGETVEITGHGSLLKRNLESAAEALRSAGVECSTNNGYLPFRVKGCIQNRRIVFSGKESSQIVSGFLMTLPLLETDTVLEIENPASIPYIELTLQTLKQFGIQIEHEKQTVSRTKNEPFTGTLIYKIKGGQQYRASRLFLDSDWSSAACFAVAFAIASSGNGTADTDRKRSYVLENMPLRSSQADEAILDVLARCGVQVEYEQRALLPDGKILADVKIQAGDILKAFDFDATHCPDLFPALTALACYCNGTSRIKGVNRLLQKESNRAETLFTEFSELGAEVDIVEDDMYIQGKPQGMLHGGNVHSHNDHRIAMSLITAALFVPEPVRLDEIKCIDKSFPSFLARLNGK